VFGIYGRRPLTRLEIGLYAVVVGIAVAVFLDRLLATMELAERAAMEETVSRINSSLSLRIAAEMLEGRSSRVQDSLQRNPFELAKLSQANYRGEVERFDPTRIDSGSWVYDQNRHELLYWPRLSRGLTTEDNSGTVRFKLVAGAAGTRYMLVPTYKYAWQ
jgi:hypothetical protein